MASLTKKVIEVPNVKSLNWDDRCAAEDKLFEELKNTSKKATVDNPNGYLMKYTVGDGYAMYVVNINTKGRIKLTHVNIYDGYIAPASTIRGTNLHTITSTLKFNKMFSK